ncbi:hypothetical protein HAX54_033406 [Datura stramonium]|uniref:Uncharacterized protein n=1 Tax=Datura stramonium TaxID=4076 RepID=A0ABS8VDC6_DATST|nr:hypothetical protein [Datura stramonium]
MTGRANIRPSDICVLQGCDDAQHITGGMMVIEISTDFVYNEVLKEVRLSAKSSYCLEQYRCSDRVFAAAVKLPLQRGLNSLQTSLCG